MGGRGSSSGGWSGGGGGVNPSNIVSTRDMGSEIAEGAHRQEAKDVLSVSDAMMREYGDSVQLDSFQVATLKGKDAVSAIAYYDGSHIAVNKNYFDQKAIEKAYADCVKNGFHPSNGSKTAMQAVAAHEYGHALTDFAAQKMGVAGLDKAASRIVNEAKRLTTHRHVAEMAGKISGYARSNPAEAVAEAVSDVYCNGSKAASESRAIVQILNGYLKKK